MNRIICKNAFMIIVFLLVLFPIKVFAVNKYDGSYLTVYSDSEIEDKCKTFADETKLPEKYGLTFFPKNDGYVLRMDTDSMAESVKDKDVKFAVTKIASYNLQSPGIFATEIIDSNMINSYIASTDKVLTKGKSIKFKPLPEKGYYVVIKLDGFKDEELKKSCGDKAYFELNFMGEGVAKKVEEQDDVSNVPHKDISNIGVSSGKMINCNNVSEATASEFNKQFCNARREALEVSDTKRSLKCDRDYYDTANGYYSGKNTKYFRKTSTDPIGQELIYEYHYSCIDDGKDVVKENAGQCIVKCEEVVTVEYGPPVAATAGFCFEYKVRVTSRVTCGVESYPPKPMEGKLCTPLPACSRAGGEVHRQGGPSEDFDQCVSACDGGTYSDRCTNKCYKKVYGKSNVKRTYGYGFNLNDEYETKKLADSHNGKYYCKGSGSKKQIFWGSAENGGNRLLSGDHDSRWHRTEAWGSGWPTNGNDTPYRCVSDTGIPRRCECGETCIWEAGSCSDLNKAYMNPGVARADYNANAEKYEKYIASCNAAATCKETTAEFTIGVDVNKKSYNYPYSTKVDKLKYGGVKTSSNNDTSILNHAGCYADSLFSIDDPPERKVRGISYQTEWSFAGSYIHNKTGELSYKYRDKNTGWQEVPGKFCLPSDAKDVNTKWWNYYYTQNSKNIDVSINSDYYRENCVGKCEFKKIESLSGINNSEYDWNIHAVTNHFGHFDWNINIDCFYALNTDGTDSSSSDGSCKEICKQSSDYRIRSVDLEKLFPATDGSDSSRKPGFNWSEYAINEVKNTNYKSNPSLYAKVVQDKGLAIFDDSKTSEEELDYHIKLTREKMREIRNKLKSNEALTTKKDDKGNIVENSGRDLFVYTEGTTKNRNGVVAYESDLIRKTLNDVSKYPDLNVLGCNNIKDRSTCDTFADGGNK